MRMSFEKADGVHATDVTLTSVRRITKQLTGTTEADLDSLARTSPSYFRRMSDPDRVEAIASLGTTACRMAFNNTHVECKLCDDNEFEEPDAQYVVEIEKLLDTLEALHSQIERRPNMLVTTMEAYRRILNHIKAPARLMLMETVAGKFALRMLRGTSRNGRLKAAALLQVFVRQASNGLSATRRANCITTLEYLQSLWQTGKLSYQEMVVIALAKFAEVAGDDELNIILLRLVEYLGHPNVYIAGLVTSELMQLAQSLHTSMQGLFRPFWRTISVVVVKNLNSRPVIAQQMCDLLGMQMSGLLQIMEEHALPYLVLNGNIDLIRKIASSNASPVNTFELCVKPANMPKIFATLLMQAFQDPEETIMKILVNTAPDFGESDLPEWLCLDPSKIAFELLKAIADAGHGKASKVFQGFQTLAQLSFRKSSTSGSGRRSDLIPSFLENKALEIVSLFTTSFDDNLLREMSVERRRCLVALGELVKIGKGRINIVIPQICACLRSAMADPALCDAAYAAWISMISNIGEDELSEVLDQTLAITVKYWAMLNSESRSTAQSGLLQLIKRCRSLLRECVDTLPSLKSIPELSELDEEIENMKQQKDELGQLQAFVTRIQDENVTVTQVALTDLVQMLRQKSDLVQKSLSREQPDPILAQLIRAILDCAVRFGYDEHVVLHAAQCLGSVGCVDSSRVESTREKPSMILLSNFAVASETTAFLMFFMEQVVVKEYVSASSLRSKSFLGWALQELLTLCQLSTEIASRTRVGGFSTKDRQWLDLSGETRLVLTPFLTSRFLAPGKRSTEKTDYPIFKSSMSFEQWLTNFILDLLNKGLSQNVDRIFEICWKLVQYSRGVSVSAF